MAGPKFFIYGGSRWREVCTTSGRVNGWGNVQFLTVRCGRLQVARKNTVLRGLRSLAASQPTTVHDGPPLSQIRYNNSIEEKRDHDCLQYQHHHCCKQNDLRYNSDVTFNNIFKAASTCSAAVQCSLEVSTCAPSSNKSIKGPNQTLATTKSGVKLLFAKRKRSSSEDEEEKPAKKHVQSNKRKNTSNEEIDFSSVGRRQTYHVDKDKNDKSKSKGIYENRKEISSSEDEQEKPAKKHVQSNKRKDTSVEEIESSLEGRRQIYHVDKGKNDKSKSRISYKNSEQIEDEKEKPAKKHVQLNKRKNTSDEEIESSLVGRRRIYDKYDINKSKTRSRIIIVSEDDRAEPVNGKKMPLRSDKHSPVKSGNVLTSPKGTRKSLRSYVNNKQEINRQQISSSEDEQEKPAKKHVQSNKRKNTSDEEIESSLEGRRQIYHVDKGKNDKSKSKGSYKNKQQISSSKDEQDVKNKTVKSTKHRNESDEEMGTALAEKRQTYDKYDKNKPKTRPRIIVLSEDDRVEPENGKKMPLRSGKQGPVTSGNVLTSPKGTRKSLRSYVNDKQEINKLNNTQSSHSSSGDTNGIQPKPGKSSQTIEEMLEKIFNTKPTRRPKRKLSSDDESYREVRSSKRVVGSNQELVNKRTKEMENGDDMCKELVITEEDIQLLRTFIEKDRDNIFDVDLEKFDTDDNHKRAIFFKLNPLVNVARCKRIATMLRTGRDQSAPVSLEDFISTLGLRSVLDTTSQASSKYRMRARRKPDEGPDKENKRSSPRKRNASSSRSMSKVLVEKVRGSGNKKKTISTKRRKGLIGKMSSRPLRSRKVVEVDLLSSDSDSDSDSVFEKSKQESALETRKGVTSEVRRPEAAALNRDSEKVVAKTSRTASRKANGRAGGKTNGRLGGKAGGREYTRAEDEAVVAWVRGAERARRVNGNQLWRELQPLHQQKTGHFRSWHSLRNRYLRYLLPSLGELALPPPEAVRLRAAAASGELKSRKNPQRANSLLREPRVRSAWSRRPRPPTRESSSPSPSRPASPARSPTHASSSSLSPPARADSSHYSSHSNSSSSSSNSSASSRDSRPKDRRRSLRNSSATKSATTETQIPRKLRSSSHASPGTPTYSQLTRRFADERAPHSADAPRPRAPPSADVPRPRTPRAPPSADPPRPRAPLSADLPRPRTRRLYNPNAT